MLISISSIGCSKQGEESNQQQAEPGNSSEQVVALELWGGEHDLNLLEQITDAFAELYKQEANIEVTLKVLNENECKDALLGDVKNSPDVFAFVDDQLPTLAASGILEEITFSKEVAAENVEGSVEAGTVNGKVYAYPITADNGYFMIYNKSYFKDKDVATMDGILAAAKKAGKKISMDWESGWYLYSFFGNTGMKLEINEDGITNYCNYNRKNGKIKGIDVAKAMYDISRSKAFINTDDTGFYEGVKNGSIIAGVSGTWKASLIKEIWGDDFAAVKLPTYTCAGQQVQMSSFRGYKMVGVNAYSKEKEWAEKLARYISNEDNQILRFEQRGQGPSNEKAAELEEVKSSQAIQAVTAQSEYAVLQRVGLNYWDPMIAYGKSFFNGTIKENNLQNSLDTLVDGITSSFNWKELGKAGAK